MVSDAPTLGGPAARPSNVVPLRRNRNFAFFLGGNTLSWAGLGVADVLLLWLVYSQTGSTLAVAAVGVAESIPPIALGYLAGALADRYSRRRLLVLMAAAQAAALGLVPISLGLVGFRLWILLAVALILESATVVFAPSSTALLPSLVESEGLDGANGLTQAFSSVAWAVGATFAAGLLVVADTSSSFGVNVLVFGAGAVLLALVAAGSTQSPASAAPAASPGFRAELAAGVRFLREHPWLLRLTLAGVAAGFFVTMFSPYLVVFTVDGLGLPPSYFGYLAGGYSAGFFVGSLLSARFRVVRYYGRFFGLALLGSGGLLGVLVLVPQFAVSLLALGGMGVLMGILITGSITLVQRVVPSELLGRYLGLQETMVWAVAPFGVLAGGVLIQFLGVRNGFAVAALGMLLVGVAALASGRLRIIGYTAPTPPEGATLGGLEASPTRLADLDVRRAQAAGDPPALVDEVRS
jgi:MFS family permease